MNTRGRAAEENFYRGYNCSQAVLLAFADILGMDEGALLSVSAPFGGGVGRTRHICGTLSGALMAAGLLLYDPAQVTGEQKSALYARVQALIARFRAENGSHICAELLAAAGIDPSATPEAEARTPAYYKKRPCPALCRAAADMLAAYLQEEGVLAADGSFTGKKPFAPANEGNERGGHER